jgi:tRNA splicing endonuclease
MSELSERFVIEKNREKIKQLVRVGAIEQESEEVHIPLLEAAYWAEKGLVDIEKEKILEAARKSDSLADDKYRVLKHLTDLGYITRASGEGDYLRVHEKGIKRGEDRTRYVLKIIPSNSSLALNDIVAMLEFAGNVRKELLIGTIKSGEIIFLKINRKKF